MIKKFNPRIILIIFLTLPAVWSLFRFGYYPSHDGNAHLIATVEMVKMGQAGAQFPIRWATNANHTFGSPIFNFYSPLFYYLAAASHHLGFSYFSSIKLVVILGFFLASLGMYFFCRQYWGEWGGVAGAVAYIYVPYRFVDAYVRGAYPEFLALAFLPWIFWGFHRSFLLGGVFLALAVLSHNFSSLVMVVLLLAYLGMMATGHWLKTEQVKKWLAGLLLGLGLAAFFWLPAMTERTYLKEGQLEVVNYKDHFVTLSQLLNSPWGYGPSLPGIENDGMSFEIGKIHLFLVLVGVLFIFPKISSSGRRVLKFMMVMTLGFLFLLLSNSDFLWQDFSFLRFGQFPWRFLGFIAFTLSFMAGGVVGGLKREKFLFWGLIGLLIVSGWSMARPVSYLKGENQRVFDQPYYTVSWSVPGFLPKWVEKPLVQAPAAKMQVVGKVEKTEIFATRYYYLLESSREQTVRLNTYYFPGWQVLVNGKKVPVEITKEGLMEFSVGAGKQKIKVIFGRTKLRLLAELVSLISVLVITVLSIKRLKH